MPLTFSRKFKACPTTLALGLPECKTEEEQNQTGVATKYLIDIQRLIACRKVSQQEHLVSSANLGAELKLVVGSTKVFSPRSNLMFRSNVGLRTGWLLNKQGWDGISGQ